MLIFREDLPLFADDVKYYICSQSMLRHVVIFVVRNHSVKMYAGVEV
jgi:hypothetical protein